MIMKKKEIIGRGGDIKEKEKKRGGGVVNTVWPKKSTASSLK